MLFVFANEAPSVAQIILVTPAGSTTTQMASRAK